MNFSQQFLYTFSTSQPGYIFMWLLVGVAMLAAVYVIRRGIFLGQSSNLHASRFMSRVLSLIAEGKPSDASLLCLSAGRRALPWIVGGAIERAQSDPVSVRAVIEERTISVIPRLEKDLVYIALFANVSTLLGLMGTIYGLIVSFAAVGAEGVEPAAKSSMLASGISAAMNTTLLGLVIAIPCMLLYTYYRNRVDGIIADIDEHMVPLIRTLSPETSIDKNYKASAKKTKEVVETEPNMVPIMGLMVVLIPLLLSSAEFVKIGRATINLPASAGASGADSDEPKTPPKTLDLGLVITAKGFTLMHSLRPAAKAPAANTDEQPPDVPVLKPGEYDFEGLTEKLKDVKRQVLGVMLGKPGSDITALTQAFLTASQSNEFYDYKDLYNIKFLAENSVTYKTIIRSMDAARSFRSEDGSKISLFPVVSMGVMR